MKAQLRKLTLDEVKVTFTMEHEFTSPKEIYSSGDEESEEAILKWLDDEEFKGNQYAWFSAKVTVSWNSFSRTEYLGCCSYESEKDFLESDCYHGLVEECLDRLNEDLSERFEALSFLLTRSE